MIINNINPTGKIKKSKGKSVAEFRSKIECSLQMLHYLSKL